ncbi:LSU ribosomal protein L6P [Orenia metallireducens]|uniref:Large ribosomal subunit protein uL6 n=1 Tax=Orenia metallireducens TaxID=1413210 RepID=A0A285H8B6_9FIRM|nr:50S ribosomal protein L6 [Orenia metallireducens]PRX26220.1 LSU ribosomal protein L6P [Orenia metallireducens]SNY31793.1 LSU ribosomal protein L6P [Orenia metallireducens]
MSRIGHQPVAIPEKVEVTIDSNVVKVKGPNGELQQVVNPRMDIKIEDNELVVTRPTDSKVDKSMHGLTRSLIVNMIEGVTEGFKKVLELNGVGYRALKKGNNLELQVGYSHPVVIEPPKGIDFEVDKNKVIVKGIDKQLVGQVAANIRAVRPPEPYKGKGIKYVDEVIRRKEGKTG